MASGTEIVPLLLISVKKIFLSYLNIYLLFLDPIALPNTHKSIGNEFSTEKHVGAMVRNFVRVKIVAENERSGVRDIITSYIFYHLCSKLSILL